MSEPQDDLNPHAPNTTADTVHNDEAPTRQFPDGRPMISQEPLVKPPSPLEVPVALVKQRGLLVGAVGLLLLLIGLLVFWRRSRES